ncbi:MAG TPA: glycoside hydrolase family 5 protein [Balneolaceae bacterium]|nr:glycoside hydrolase family 5 protein [Balneolaceae bacterium]
MKKIFAILGLALAGLFLHPNFIRAQPRSSQSAGYVIVKGDHLVKPNGGKLFLKGIGLGNWLLPEGYMWKFGKTNSPRKINQVISQLLGPAAARDFWKKYRDNYITREDIAYIKKIGMNSVRVPINYRVLTPERHPDVWLESGFDHLDQIIKWCRQEGIYVILDMHAAPGGQTGENIDDGWGYPYLFKSPESQQRTIKIWEKLAKRYKDDPTVLGYDLLNEPIPTFEGYDKLNRYLVPLYKRITKAIRKIDSNHVIIVEGAQWAGNFKIFGKPFDDNMMYSFHKYWMPPKQNQIQEYVDFRDKYNVPIWLGESGENDNAWVENFRQLLEKNDIGWSFWPYKKLEAKSCIVTVNPPEGWDKIVDFAHQWGSDFKTLRKHRPSLEESQKILNQLLKNVQFAHCEPNPGYIKALGLKL